METNGSAQLNDSADSLVKRSEQTRTSAAKIARLTCGLIGIDYHDTKTCLIGPIKTKERIIEKTITDYRGRINDVNDGCRLMLLFDDASTIAKINNKIIPGKNRSALEKELSRTNFNLAAAKDMVTTPKKWGYMGYLLKFTPKGKLNLHAPFEIQITSRVLMEHYFPKTHAMYESVRKKIEDYEQKGIPQEEWDNDTRGVVMAMRELHRQGAEKSGIAPYVKHWPNQTDTDAPEEDTPQIHYESMALTY